MAQDTVNLKFRIAPVQRQALQDEADRLEVSVSALVREAIAAKTRTPDPLHKGYRRTQRVQPVT